MTDAALFSANDAASYLGVSRSYFDDHIRPFLAVVARCAGRVGSPQAVGR